MMDKIEAYEKVLRDLEVERLRLVSLILELQQRLEEIKSSEVAKAVVALRRAS